MCVKPLIASDQAGDARRGVLNLRGEAAHRAAGGGPAQRRRRARVPRRPRPADRAPRTSPRSRRAPRRARRRGRDRRASRRSPPRARPARSATARPARASTGTTLRTASTAASWASVSLAAPSARAACSASSSRSSSSAALRSIADAGLFSSCASPADSFPSETIFSSCRSLDVKARARSTIVWTRIDVISWHSRISARRCSRGTARISVGFLRDRIARRADQARVREAGP